MSSGVPSRPRGIVACSSVDEYDNGTIRKHERTRRDKEDDRTRHMLMLRAQSEWRAHPAGRSLAPDYPPDPEGLT